MIKGISFTLIPIFMAVGFYKLRYKRPLSSYTLVSGVTLAIMLGFWKLWPNITFFRAGPLMASGSYTWVLPAEVLCISLILLPKFHRKAIKRTQLVIALCFGLVVGELGGWIA